MTEEKQVNELYIYDREVVATHSLSQAVIDICHFGVGKTPAKVRAALLSGEDIYTTSRIYRLR